MGYTHYWERNEEYDSVRFAQAMRDIEQVRRALQDIIPLAGADGTGAPVITAEEIAFNGMRACDHRKRNLGITWPAPTAAGVSLAHHEGAPVAAATIVTMLTGEQEELALGDSDVAGQWIAGAQLQNRTCGGDCSHESFWFPRAQRRESWQELRDGRFFQCCKTAFKPYDVLVTASLVILKHHFGNGILVRSDGDLAQWQDAIRLCEAQLGYGRDFRLDKKRAA